MQKYTVALSFALFFSTFSISAMIYRYRKDLSSVKHLEAVYKAYESGACINKYDVSLHEVFYDEIDLETGDCIRQTILTHALRNREFSAEFIKKLIDAGVTDPLNSIDCHLIGLVEIPEEPLKPPFSEVTKIAACKKRHNKLSISYFQ